MQLCRSGTIKPSREECEVIFGRALIKEEYFSKRYFYLENPKKENKKDSEAFLFL